MSRVLFVSDRYPESGNGAGERTLSIYNSLQKVAEVDLLVIAVPVARYPPDPGVRIVHLLDDDTKATRWYWRRRAYLLKDFRTDPKVRAVVQSAMTERRYDAFFGRYHMPFLAGCHEFGPSFIDVDDLAMDTWSSNVPGFNAIRRMAYLRALAKQTTVFVTKRADAGRISHPDVRLLPCISTLPDKTGPIVDRQVRGRMLFVGSPVWPPNREGIQRFIQSSLPSVRQLVSNAVVRIVGRQGTALAGPDGVSCADFIPDLVPEYEQASIVICPIRRGAGSIVKLAEAAAYGKAIVTTSFGARGYEGILTPGRDLMVADSDQEFAAACVKLLTNDELRMQLGDNARRAAAGVLDQQGVDRVIRDAMRSCLRLS